MLRQDALKTAVRFSSLLVKACDKEVSRQSSDEQLPRKDELQEIVAMLDASEIIKASKVRVDEMRQSLVTLTNNLQTKNETEKSATRLVRPLVHLYCHMRFFGVD